MEEASAPVLPIHAFEEEICHSVSKNSAIVLIGETGSGKTTQVSQFLHKAGFTKDGMIGVTQPRRVAAVSVARRVASEMGVQVGAEVGYSVRFEDRTSRQTRIKYLTDGILLRECLADPSLSQYSVIILDEAHERSLNTDILFGVLKRLMLSPTSKLKLVVTSATLEEHKFADFFGGCPVLKVPGRLHPVKIMHALERPISYLESAVETVMDIHANEGPGDILVFLTGQEEIEKAVKKLTDRVMTLEQGTCQDMLILPLYGSLPPEAQVRIFRPAPPGCRKVVVATNVAETSVTVDGIVYVVDPGFVKQRQYNPQTGMDSLGVVPISRVQAVQRAGRAGRTRPGQCYRLYPQSVFDHELPPVTLPEIQRSSLTGAVLHLKSLSLPGLDVLHFEFLDPPPREALGDALRQLYLLDAIDADGDVTPLGRKMADLPLEPHLARVLLAAADLGSLDEALTVTAMLSCEGVFTQRSDGDRGGSLPDGDGLGDHVMLLQLYRRWEKAGRDPDWCRQKGLQARSLKFAADVRRQLAAAVSKEADVRNGSGREPDRNQKSEKRRDGSTEERTVPLRKALCIGFANKLARRMTKHNGYRTMGEKSQLVQVHPSNARLQVDDDGLLPEWVLYHELVATSRPFIRHCCKVEGAWVDPLVRRTEGLDLQRLSGQPATLGEEAGPGESAKGAKVDRSVSGSGSQKRPPLEDKSIEDAKARYLARKKGRTK
ncbi:ATP-dependent RNA helicase DHX8/PRP22 [Klebsormidium nitens]|uniref:RNA helicase n=1 Tax=Klebsormidium nitens TaxID=105231 RepID=A0A1Y1HRS4_KLENI|nr:ATP-dependent RNA helicase DHX8/PRP22 [Klebsormidium nitens]|eukprot:GAQ81335.1 ATP-dependent RNA helicase DHX8/PRP22 [Klebsormidium nitens]